jgi:hypothetical protein
MLPSFLSLLRGVEGRRLALVLAAILFVGGILNGVGAGAAAGTGANGLSLCSVHGSADAPAQQPADHGFDCCFAGHAPGLAGLPPPVADGILRPFGSRVGTFRVAVAGITHRPLVASEGPRGPPLLA